MKGLSRHECFQEGRRVNKAKMATFAVAFFALSACAGGSPDAPSPENPSAELKAMEYPVSHLPGELRI